MVQKGWQFIFVTIKKNNPIASLFFFFVNFFFKKNNNNFFSNVYFLFLAKFVSICVF